ncbi:MULTISPECIES: hypothetical protein [Pseudomonas]|uniref:hypothetical protein n=1 Tax=Pseudomonas TaxID=286 RepID=UPI0013CE8BA8|nr:MULTISPECIES: hypothetical protein [Pseudomonas]MBD8615467.1 hypothetical protein [Pseudomonas putida]MBD8681880.1 hypothetical protein [Pseudomonas sp. CFBP 13719]
MKKIALLSIACLLQGLTLAANAHNIIRIMAPITQASGTWSPIEAFTSPWANWGEVSSCSNWSPDPSIINTGVSFTQTATDCLQPQQMSIQDRESNSYTHEVRPVGVPQISHRSIQVSSGRSATGTFTGTWSAIASTSTGWMNEGALSNCSNWSPDPSTVSVGVAFSQTASDCQQQQKMTSQAREQNSLTSEIRNAGDPQVSRKTTLVSSMRSAVGTFEGTWSQIASLSSEWANVGEPGGCSAWSPAVDTVSMGASFTQTSTCQQPQQKTVQDREQNSQSGQIRNVGSPKVSQQTIQVTSTRTAVGTSSPTSIDFTNSTSASQLQVSTSASFNRGPTGWFNTNHAHSSTSFVTFTPINLQAQTVLTFNYNVSSEGGYDLLRIYVGTVQVLALGGSTSGQVSYTVPTTGSYAIKFQYSKDTGLSVGADTGTVSAMTIKRP